MNYRVLMMLMIGLCFLHNHSKAQKLSAQDNKIIIEVEFPKDDKRTAIQLESALFDFYANLSWKAMEPDVKLDFSKWTTYSDGSLLVNLTPIFKEWKPLYLLEPGDSVRLVVKNEELNYSGKGSEKFCLLQALEKKQQSLVLPANPTHKTTKSLEDYLEWSAYLDKKLKNIDSVFDAYKAAISPSAYGYLKAEGIAAIEHTRLMKFGRLMGLLSKGGITGEKLGQVFDSTAYSKPAVWLSSDTGKIMANHHSYHFIRTSIERKYNFNYEHDIFKSAKRKTVYADLAKKIYKGDMLQGFMVFLLTEQGLKEHTLKDGSTPEIEELLAEFYAMPGYTESKAYVRDYERWIRQWVGTFGMKAPGFSLEDVNGKMINKEQFKGKLVLMSFLNKPDIRTTNALRTIQQTFDNNPNIVLLNIFIEEDKTVWKKSLSVTDYRIKDAINLYTNGLGTDHPLINYYCVNAYPQFFLLDREGRFLYNGEFYANRGKAKTMQRLANTLPDPRNDDGKALINKIYEQLPLINDGPYVFYEKGSIAAYTIQSSKAVKQQYSDKSNVKITSQTDDLRKTIPVQLKTKLELERAVTTARPEKLFVLSDIEGEFDTFKKLLQSNKIIDDQFNWTFGKGHLVFAGDMFDRGLQVTECLWLMYMLEEKAKVAGGYVHFILGNHEIMNLQGDHKYVKSKYKDNAALMGKTLIQLYNEDSELGRWLRTKNIVEKIGDLLFTHGGISKELNSQSMSVEQINSIARPFYADSAVAKNTNAKVNLLYGSTTSPFWYRLYYETDHLSQSSNKWVYKTKENQVDSTLQKFNVKHIITGHTIVADTISTHYNNKVINTDTKHREGKSEALLIEGANFYRVNAEGKRVLLFRDDEK
jgi:hypothetical protein